MLYHYRNKNLGQSGAIKPEKTQGYNDRTYNASNINTNLEKKFRKKYDETHIEFLHTIGNLTLTAYDGNLSNKNFRDKKEIFRSLTQHKDFEGVHKRRISDSEESMNFGYKVGEGIYIDLHGRAVELVNYCVLLAEKFEMENDILIMLKPKYN